MPGGCAGRVRRGVQTGAQARGRRKGSAGVEVQMACIDLLILLEGIGPRPNVLHHVLPTVRVVSDWARRGCSTLRSHGTKGVGRPWVGERDTRQRRWRGKHGSKKTAASQPSS